MQLIFSLARYEAVIDAYLDGLEASGLSDLSRVTSVASFFVSRVDTLVDKMLEKIGTPEALDLRGKVVQMHIQEISNSLLGQRIGVEAVLIVILFCLTGGKCSGSSGLSAVPEEILGAEMGEAGEERS